MLAAGRVEAGTAGDVIGGGSFSPADHRFIQHLLHTCHHAGHMDGRQEERALPEAGNRQPCGDTGRNRKEVQEMVGQHSRPLGASSLPRFVRGTSRAPRARAHPPACPTPFSRTPLSRHPLPSGHLGFTSEGCPHTKVQPVHAPSLRLRSEPSHKPGEAGVPHTSSQQPSTAVVPETQP